MSDEETSSRAELEERVRRLLVVGGTAVVVVVALVVGFIFGPAMSVLVLAVGALIAAIATLWQSIRALFGETPLSREDAFAIGAPSAEEEQKRAVLRAIKDLEFEHSVGKISREDYQVLVSRYRAEAKRLLRQIDDQASPERERVERMVAAHLRARGIEPGWLSPTRPDLADRNGAREGAPEEDADGVTPPGETSAHAEAVADEEPDADEPSVEEERA